MPLIQAYVPAATQAGDPVQLLVIPGVGHFEVASPLASTWPTVESAIRSLLNGRCRQTAGAALRNPAGGEPQIEFSSRAGTSELPTGPSLVGLWRSSWRVASGKPFRRLSRITKPPSDEG